MTPSGFSDRAQEALADIPTDTEAFLRWGAQRKREEGKFELSRGRVRRTEPYATRAHARVCTNMLAEVARLLDDAPFDVGLSSDGAWPRLPTELAGREGAIALGGLGIELSMAAIFRGIPDAATAG